ncbi:hypothetical protein DFA_07532 [Cavenderia fasciculata]|uniref:Uncharacterized protein n=1 Tax=Cavenderia fasciculata TaxID=261658 RepID=F4PWP4_CACFS|nr:uncharacterized protein DFA_07532 [Cavenderia fasciculata]EGG20408.1 hypothetical protein DFA_07532 [Cavenderia fasciculata]|eukprot:XP_004367391.1 hypothetical protein DFA_07532 [Cavenderia fasciculata]
MLSPFGLNVLSQSHFQLPLNHTTTNNHDHQQMEIISIHSSMSHIPLNSSDVLFHCQSPNHSPTTNNLNLDQEVSVQLNSSSTILVSFFNQSIPIDINNNNNISFFNDHQSLIPCFKSSDILTHSTTNNHIFLEEEEEFVQLNNSSSSSTHSLTCLDNVNHQSISIINQPNNNYFSLIHSSSLISPNHFISSSSTLYLLSKTINPTRSKTSPFSTYSSNISRIENNNNAVTSSINLKHFTDASSFIFIDTKVANNYFDTLNCFGTNHSNHTTIQQQQPSSSPINHHTILTTIHVHNSTHNNQYSQITPSSNNNNNNTMNQPHLFTH